eukprot:PhF_6_TR25181/c0_g2_i1/m.34745
MFRCIMYCLFFYAHGITITPWPNGNIPYSFSDTTNKQYTLARVNVLKVMKLFQSKTCLEFTVNTNAAPPRVLFDLTETSCLPTYFGYNSIADVTFGASSECSIADLIVGFQQVLG